MGNETPERERNTKTKFLRGGPIILAAGAQ